MKLSEPSFVLSGIADEAADDIGGQISAHLELGWKWIELRQVGGKQAANAMLPDAEFEQALEQILASGLRVSGFSSPIGNWSRRIDEDFQRDLDDLAVVLRRMQICGAKFVRTMSWVGQHVDRDFWRDEAVRRYRTMAQMAADADVQIVHENCEGWGGLGPAFAREFMERINHPNVGALFDIGNTVAYGHEPLEFLRQIRPFVRYVHVKDCRRNPLGGKGDAFTMPGEGDACVREVLSELMRSGYAGTISIEPHVASIIHLGSSTASPELRRSSYLAYGRRLESLLAELRA